MGSGDSGEGGFCGGEGAGVVGGGKSGDEELVEVGVGEEGFLGGGGHKVCVSSNGMRVWRFWCGGGVFRHWTRNGVRVCGG